MSDHVWADHIEPAFDAALWVLSRLYDVLGELDATGCGVRSELSSAAEDVRNLRINLDKIKGQCYTRRE